MVNHSSRLAINLEGDGPLAPVCYEMLSSARASVQVKHWPNTQAVAWKLA